MIRASPTVTHVEPTNKITIFTINNNKFRLLITKNIPKKIKFKHKYKSPTSLWIQLSKIYFADPPFLP